MYPKNCMVCHLVKISNDTLVLKALNMYQVRPSSNPTMRDCKHPLYRSIPLSLSLPPSPPLSLYKAPETLVVTPLKFLFKVYTKNQAKGERIPQSLIIRRKWSKRKWKKTKRKKPEQKSTKPVEWTYDKVVLEGDGKKTHSTHFLKEFWIWKISDQGFETYYPVIANHKKRW